MALKLSGSISLTGSLASNSSIEATVVSSSFFTGSYLDGLGNSGSADEVLISDGTGASVYQEINFLTNQGVTPASVNEFSISWEGGLNFSASALKVFGPGESFSRKQLNNKLLTLSSADGSNPRFDVFVFRTNQNDSTSGSIEIIEGTPNANPVYPDIDGNTEVPLKFVLIKAGASLPSDGSNEEDINTSDFSSANIYSDNAFDGNTWYTHGTSDTGANISGSVFFLSANNQRDYEYGNTVHGTAIKWPRTGYYNKFARAARIAFVHPSWESNGGIEVGDLDQLKLDIKFPSATTGDTSIAKQYRTQVYSNMYIEVWLLSGVTNSNGTYSVTTVARSRTNIGRTLDLTSDQFQTVTIDQASMQKYNAGKVTSGTKINYIYVNFYKNQWPYNSNGLGVPVADGLFIDNITWVNGSGASPQLDPEGKTISKATASEPVALSGKNNNAEGTSTAIVAGENNTVTTNRSFIGAGRNNLITGNTDSVIGGGSFNSSSNSCTFIGGGSNNILTGSAVSSSIIGGLNNSSSLANTHIIGSNITADKANYTYVNNIHIDGVVSGSTFSGSFVGDGSGLTGISGGGGSADDDWGDAGTYISSSKGISVTGGITGSALTIGNNHTTVGGSALASILAGSTNCLSASNYSAIIGGAINRVKTSAASTITHGCSNCISGSGMSIAGGRSNCVMDADCVGVLSGFCNLISGSNWNIIGGGYQNNICRTTYGAGGTNVIGGGQENCITGGGSWTGYATFIGAGRYNTGSGDSSAIGAGMNNSVSQGDRNFIGAGFCNSITGSGDNNFIGSGELNKINSNATGSNTIVGGCQNCVVGTFGTVVGGRQNCITHKDSFVAGTCITSSAENTFYVNNLFSTGSDGSNNVVILANLPTINPNNPGQLWNDSGTLKISAG